MRIRAATAADRETAYAIALATGDEGADASVRHRHPDLIGEVYVGPYLAFASDHAFVLVDDDDVPRGYVLGVADTRQFEQRLAADWWPQVRSRTAGIADPTTADAAMLARIAGPGSTPADVAAAYPAHGHIDLLPAAQGHGHGRALMSRVMTSLAEAGAPGMHLQVGRTNARALQFYARLGFERIRQAGDSVFVGRQLAIR